MVVVQSFTGNIPPLFTASFSLPAGTYYIRENLAPSSAEGVLRTNFGNQLATFVGGQQGVGPFVLSVETFLVTSLLHFGSSISFNIEIYTQEEEGLPPPTFQAVEQTKQDNSTIIVVPFPQTGTWPSGTYPQIQTSPSDWTVTTSVSNQINISKPTNVECGSYLVEYNVTNGVLVSSSQFVEVTITGCTSALPEQSSSYVYELEKGWSFDGKYIPHYLELNWLFNEDPFTYHEMQKVRIHGLTKGNVDLQVAMSGMQGDATTDYLEDYTEPQFIDLPFTPIHISEDFLPSTNYTDVVSRGIGIQMKFEGRNTDVNLPEPAHAIQVLALQASPQGNGKRAN